MNPLPRGFAYDDHLVDVLSDCLTQVRNALADHSVCVNDEISGVIARALLSKARDGKANREKLTAYATFKAWGYIWRTDSEVIDAPIHEVSHSFPPQSVT